jgi:hypothetical protein
MEVVIRNKCKEGGSKMIKTVIRLKDDAVMVFDDQGEPMTAYQGRYDSVKAKIVQDAPVEAVFLHWFGSGAIPETVSREEW